jgi:hypothetical protein
MNSKLTALIEVRKIIALLFAALFVFLMVSGTISVDQGLPLITMVIGYYFGKSTALDKGADSNASQVNQ